MPVTTTTLTRLPPKMRLAAARAVARDKMPYFTIAIANLVPVIVESKSVTMGVTRDGLLIVNPAWLGTLTVDEAATVLIHEWLHLYLKHLDRTTALVSMGVLSRSPEDAKLANLAGDCEINDNLEEADLPLPAGGVLPKRYDFPDHRSFEEYVDLLKKRRAEQPDDDGDFDPIGTVGAGQCGSGAGNPLPEEDALLADVRAELQRTHGSPEARSEVDLEVLRKDAAGQIMSHADAPQGLRRHAASLVASPEVPWQVELAVAARDAVQHRAGAIDYTYRKRSRRQDAAGQAMGSPILPGMHAPVANVAVVFDTSGSMDDSAMEMIQREVVGVLRALPGATITVLAVDAAVHGGQQRVRTASAIKLAGGGGTSFVPAFEELARVRPKIDVCVFGTDGIGTYPSRPPAFKTIWLQTPGGSVTADFGKVIPVK